MKLIFDIVSTNGGSSLWKIKYKHKIYCGCQWALYLVIVVRTLITLVVICFLMSKFYVCMWLVNDENQRGSQIRILREYRKAEIFILNFYRGAI